MSKKMYVIEKQFQKKIENLAKESGLWQIFDELNVQFPYPEVIEFYEFAYALGVWCEEGDIDEQSV